MCSKSPMYALGFSSRYDTRGSKEKRKKLR